MTWFRLHRLSKNGIILGQQDDSIERSHSIISDRTVFLVRPLPPTAAEHFSVWETKRLCRTVNTVTYYLDCYPSASAGQETAWVINQRQSNSGSVDLNRLPTRDGPAIRHISPPFKTGKETVMAARCNCRCSPGCELHEKLRGDFLCETRDPSAF